MVGTTRIVTNVEPGFLVLECGHKISRDPKTRVIKETLESNNFLYDLILPDPNDVSYITLDQLQVEDTCPCDLAKAPAP